MEQWNEKQNKSDNTLSLRRIMELRYLALLMQKKNLSIEEVNGETLREAIDYVLSLGNDVGSEEDIADEDNYIKYQCKILFKILDSIIPDSRKKLSDTTTNRFCFNLENLQFIHMLLNYYQDKEDSNCKNLLGENYSELDFDFKNFLHQGLLGLAENDKTNLQIEEVNREWNLRFKPILKEIYDIADSLKLNIDFFVCKIDQENKDIEELKAIKDMLKKWDDDITAYIEDRIGCFNSDMELIFPVLKQFVIDKHMSQKK